MARGGQSAYRTARLRTNRQDAMTAAEDAVRHWDDSSHLIADVPVVLRAA
jgi:hypothetical protein